MSLWNTKERFGVVFKICHWLVFALVASQFFLVYRRETFTDEMHEKLQYILLHKSLGVLILGLALLMVVVRHVGTRPFPATNMTPFSDQAGKINAHWALCKLIFDAYFGLFNVYLWGVWRFFFWKKFA